MVLHTVGIVVSDMAKSLNFFRTLGVEIPVEADQWPHVDVALASGISLGFDLEANVLANDPSWTTPVGQRYNLQFDFGTPDAVDAVFEKLVEAGYMGYNEPWNTPWGQRFARVSDPDGNVVNFFAEL